MSAEPMWRQVFRTGFAPVLPTAGLEALAAALRGDDPRLLQGATTAPPPLMCHQDAPCEGACLVGYAFWRGGRGTVGKVERFFADACDRATRRLGDNQIGRVFLNWFDGTPRDVMRRELLPEVERELARRREATELADRRAAADDVVYFGPDPADDSDPDEPTDPEPTPVQAPDLSGEG